MSSILPYIVIGIASGAVYGLGGVGLVLTYRTSGLLNFGHGAIATSGAFVFYHLFEERHLPAGLAFSLAVGSGVLIGLAFAPIAKALSTARLASQITATVGVLLAVQAILVIQYGAGSRRFPKFLPGGIHNLGGTIIRDDQIIVVVVSLVATIMLSMFLAYAGLGRKMRAVVDDEDLISLSGTSPVAVRRWAWVIGATFATLSGVLIAPNLQLDATALTLLVVQTFGAAAIGRFRSLPLTWIGGVGIGIAAALATKYIGTIEWMGGIPNSLPFLVLLAALLVMRPSSSIASRPTGRSLAFAGSARLGGLRSQLGVAGAAVVALLFVPALVSVRLDAWTFALTHFILLLSLGLLVRTSGQVSLGHVAFAAIGATTFSRLSVDWNVPWLPALVLAGLVAVPIGALLAIPAVRLSGLYLALATFGFGILAQSLFYNTSLMFGATNGGRAMPQPRFLGIDFSDRRNFYFLVLGFAVLSAFAVVILTRSRLGRLLRALADSPLALSTSGESVAVLRVIVFCVSAFLAAISGALSGMVITRATGSSYAPLNSLVYVVVVVIAVGGLPWYALISAIAVDIVPTYLSGNASSWMQLVFGVAAVATGVGLADKMPLLMKRRRWAVAEEPARPIVTPAAKARSVPPAPTRPIGLEVRGLAVHFGGLIAISGLSLEAPAGRITGLIGPNGAGKTTTFNACTGLVRPTAGDILLDGEFVTREPPAQRARRGLGRTFQRIELYDSLTVAENVALGREAAFAGRRPLAHLLNPPSERDAVRRAAQDAMELCGLHPIAARQVGLLSTGQRRLVELARCLAGPFGLLLLDEPSSGLDNSETEQFGSLLQTVVDERGCGLLLVEHDMSLVMAVCEHIYVVDFGRPIFDGSPSEVASSPAVRAAYLGATEADEPVPIPVGAT